MRRRLALLAALVSTVAIATACSDMSAPRRDGPCSGYVTATGECVPDTTK
jgi:hypothetical protein